MTVDLGPEALIEHLLARAFAIQHNAAPETVRLLRQAADTIAALRAVTPVAMRERVWNEAVTASAQIAGLWSVPEDGPDMTEAEGRAFADGKLHAVEMIRKLLKPAIPIDAPAPADPVAEAARVLLDLLHMRNGRHKGMTTESAQALWDAASKRSGFDAVTAFLNALAQEPPHDRP